MTERLRKIINRDTIVIVSIVGPVASLLDTVIETSLNRTDKLAIYVLISLFILVGVLRLIKHSLFDRKPIYSIVVYELILIPVTVYFSDVRSFYIFFWLIPIFLASFYYSKKVIYYSFGVLALAQIGKIIVFTKFGYITRTEDYLYMIAEFFVVVALSMLFIDLTLLSEEDRTILVNSLEKTELEHDRLSAVMNSINDGVVAVDRNFGIVSYNSAALNILDRHDDILGKDFRQVCFVESLDGKSIEIAGLLRGDLIDTECEITYSDGEKAKLALSALPIKVQSSQENEGSVFLLRDITKQKSLEDERNAFVSLMSHELRTPLSIAEASVSNAELLMKKGDNAKASEALSKVTDEISHLSHVTNEFSLVIDSTSGAKQLAKEAVRLEDICNRLNSTFKQIAERKGIVFSAFTAPNIVEEIYTSPDYFEHIVNSLVDNAIEFTNDGSVTVSFSEQKEVFITNVEDTGSGISKSDHAKIFSPFYQSEDYETRAHGGLGVGLYTAQKLASIIGGKITFTSEKDHGSIFTLNIPLSELIVSKQTSKSD